MGIQILCLCLLFLCSCNFVPRYFPTCFSVSASAGDHVDIISTDPSSTISDVSLSFSIKELNFNCPSRLCHHGLGSDGGIGDALRNSYVHLMVGLETKSFLPLLIYQICDALQYCIPLENFKIAIHVKDNENIAAQNKNTLDLTLNILSRIGIMPDIWNDTFTSNSKMMFYLSKFEGIGDANQFIFHTDLDEFPDRMALLAAVKELEVGDCDAIRGYWVDRISADGSLKEIKLVSPPFGSSGKVGSRSANEQLTVASSSLLEDQFPLKCDISSSFMPLRTTKKVLIYRSTYRLASGQHDVWCDFHQADIYKNKHVTRKKAFFLGLKSHSNIGIKPLDEYKSDSSNSSNRRKLVYVDKSRPSGNDLVEVKSEDNAKDSEPQQLPWNFRAACINHISSRFDRSSDSYDIFRLIPETSRRPKFCSATVPINHYKFTAGLEDYLKNRITTYRGLGFNWWKQSRNILDYVEEHGGKICIDCKENKCTR